MKLQQWSRQGVAQALLVGAVLAAPIGSFGPQNPADADITYWVKDALRCDKRLEAAKITVSTEKGIATLAGETDSLAGKQYAELEAKKVNGVLGVIDEIVVAPAWRSDAEIRDAVRRRILDSAIIHTQALDVACTDGKVHLTGTADSWSEREQAGLLASEVRGVKEVANDISRHWQAHRSDKEIEGDVESALNRDVYLSGLPITVSVKDGWVALAGSVGSVFEKDRATEKARWIMDVKGVKNGILVEWWENYGARKKAVFESDDVLRQAVRNALDQDERIVASGITARVSFGHITLDGSVASHYEKRLAGQDANNVIGVAWVTNNLFPLVDKRADWLVKDDIDFELHTDYSLGISAIDSSVKDGVVTLTGEVQNWFEKTHARDVVEGVKGVRSVVNRIAVHRVTYKDDAEVAKSIRDRLMWNWITASALGNVTVSVKNGVATLTGKVGNWSELREAGLVAYHTEGVWRVDNKLTVGGYDYPWNDWSSKASGDYDPYYDPFFGVDYFDYYEYPWLHW